MSQKEMKHKDFEKVSITNTFLITRQFSSPSEFSIYIEKEALRRKIGYMETLLEYCDDNNIDTSSVGGIVSSSLKEKIRAEAEEINVLKKTGKLPL
jgi:hypothetical protein